MTKVNISPQVFFTLDRAPLPMAPHINTFAVCQSKGCNRTGMRGNDYNNSFCVKHSMEYRAIRRRISNAKGTGDFELELSARTREKDFRKSMDKGHQSRIAELIYRIAVLQAAGLRC